MQIHDAAAHLAADCFFSDGPARNLRPVRTQQSGRGVGAKRRDDAGYEGRDINQLSRGWPERYGFGNRLPGTRMGFH